MSGSVDSVYIFVSDALRYDRTPDRLSDYGPVVKTAASATNTCTSFPTIMTGLYPPQHGVWTFSGLVDPSTPTIFDLVDGSFPCYWTPSPVHDSVDDVAHNNDLAAFLRELDRHEGPFVVLDRDNSTHLPYGYDSADGVDEATERYGYDMSPPLRSEDGKLTTDEYRASRAGDFERRRSEYDLAAEASVRRFENRLNVLRDFGMLEDTLVVFTADHGEELGEFGRFTHGRTPVPGTVYVPTLFHRPDGEITAEGDFMSHTDLFPTMASAMGEPTPDGPGYDLFEGVPDGRLVFSAIRTSSYSGERLEYGAWERDGGHAFSDVLKDVPAEIVHFLKEREYSWREALAVARGEFARRNRAFGAPESDRDEARRFCRNVLERSEGGSNRTQELDDEVKDHLEDLGYREDTIE